MPIYAYRCSACGFAKDVLQKISDAPLTTCPNCSQEQFSKQVTAAGFQLKGSGWYVTDFRGGSNASSSKSDANTESAASTEGAKSEAASPTPASTSPTPATAAPANSTSSGSNSAASSNSASANSSNSSASN